MSVDEQLVAMGFELVRQSGKHPVYRHRESGLPLIGVKSGSDWRGDKNLLSTARRIAGVQREMRKSTRQRGPGRTPNWQVVREYASERGVYMTENQARALLNRQGSVREVKRWVDRIVEAASRTSN